MELSDYIPHRVCHHDDIAKKYMKDVEVHKLTKSEIKKEMTAEHERELLENHKAGSFKNMRILTKLTTGD
jgi:hypothetical protein